MKITTNIIDLKVALEKVENFIQKYNVRIDVKFLHYGKHLVDDNYKRDVYNVTIKRVFPATSGCRLKEYSFLFGQSIAHSCPNKRQRPTDYEILTCLEKYEPPLNVWQFANEFGYEINSRESLHQTETLYMACQKEYQAVLKLFGDCMEELQEIC